MSIRFAKHLPTLVKSAHYYTSCYVVPRHAHELVTTTIKCYANILFFLRLDLLPAIDNGDNISQRMWIIKVKRGQIGTAIFVRLCFVFIWLNCWCQDLFTFKVHAAYQKFFVQKEQNLAIIASFIYQRYFRKNFPKNL